MIRNKFNTLTLVFTILFMVLTIQKCSAQDIQANSAQGAPALIEQLKTDPNLHRGGLGVWVYRNGTEKHPQPIKGARVELRLPGKEEALNSAVSGDDGHAIFNQPLSGVTGLRDVVVTEPEHKTFTTQVDLLLQARNAILAPLFRNSEAMQKSPASSCLPGQVRPGDQLGN